MAKILTPNKDYSGISASVPFINGVGYTDDEDLISWFEEHGYGVEVEVENTEVENKPKGESKPKSSAKAGDESKDESDDPGENKPE